MYSESKQVEKIPSPLTNLLKSLVFKMTFTASSVFFEYSLVWAGRYFHLEASHLYSYRAGCTILKVKLRFKIRMLNLIFLLKINERD